MSLAVCSVKFLNKADGMFGFCTVMYVHKPHYNVAYVYVTAVLERTHSMKNVRVRDKWRKRRVGREKKF